MGGTMSYPDGIPGEPFLVAACYGVSQIPRLWRSVRGQWMEGDRVRCPECGRRARLEHFYGPFDESMLATSCCGEVVVTEAEAGGALVYPYGVNLWLIKTNAAQRKGTR